MLSHLPTINKLTLVLAMVLFSVGCVKIPPVVAQETRKAPTNDELRLRNLNSKLRVRQLEFHELKERRDGLIYQVERAEQAFDRLRDRRDRLRQQIQREKQAAKANAEAKKELEDNPDKDY